MGLIEALILGFLQGFTEFLPISSSAHLRIVGEFIGTGGDPGAAFTAITQIGTEAAVIVFFWRDITRIISRWWLSLTGKIPRTDPDAKLGWFIIIGTIPIVVLGFTFQEQIETSLRSLWLIATMLIVFGILLGLVDWLASRQRTLDTLTWPHAIVFGFAQALALIPGISRSGGTITAGRLLGYDRTSAARYSFLLAIPAVLGSGFYQIYKVAADPCAPDCVPEVFGPLHTAAATVVAFGVALVVISLFMRFITRHTFLPFVVYRVLLGGLILTLLATGVLQS